MTQDSLEKLPDDELRAVIARAETLLTQHDTERKEKALNEARATLAAVGLSLKDLKGRKPERDCLSWRPAIPSPAEYGADLERAWQEAGVAGHPRS